MIYVVSCCFFFFSSRRRHTRCSRDWSSDVCSSDLLASCAYQVLLGRVGAWLGRGVRSPARKALLAADVPPNAYGRAFGLERLMDTLGAIVGPLTALWLLRVTDHSYRKVFFWTLLPGFVAVACFWLLVREQIGRAHV